MVDITVTKSPMVPDQVGVKRVDKFVSGTVALTVSGGATPNNKADIDVDGYRDFTLEADHDTLTGDASTSLTYEVFASLGGTAFGTTPIATITFTTTGIKHASFSVLARKLRVKATNADAANADNSQFTLAAGVG